MAHAEESYTGNWYNFLEHLSCFLAQVLIWYKFLAPNRTQLCSAQESCSHMSKIEQFDWLV